MDLSSAKARLLSSLRSQIADQRVLASMAKVPRELFIPARLEALAYSDEPLPIGHGQTISQPLIVAMMTEALELQDTEKVLEIGTGSGYQTAILAELARLVVTTERIPELSQNASALLKRLGYTNIQFELTGATLGWEKGSPYQAIMVTAATPRIPDVLVRQLAVGGRMAIPVGNREIQELYHVIRLNDRNVIRSLGGCRFVPLIGHEAWD